jgi:hypothetical protein
MEPVTKLKLVPPAIQRAPISDERLSSVMLTALERSTSGRATADGMTWTLRRLGVGADVVQIRRILNLLVEAGGLEFVERDAIKDRRPGFVCFVYQVKGRKK